MGFWNELKDLTGLGDSMILSATRMGEIGVIPAQDENSFTAQQVRGGVSWLDNDDCALLSVQASISQHSYMIGAFASRGAIALPLTVPAGTRIAASRYDNCPWWQMPYFPEDISSVTRATQHILLEKDGMYIALLPLTGKNFRAEFEAGALRVSPDTAGIVEIAGPVLCAAKDRDPFEAERKSFAFARETGALPIALRAERTYPEMFSGFGFCTWDAFYRGVSAEKIYEKLAEFKEKGIPTEWMIVDDGWIQNDDSRLTDFAPIEEKFPGGFAPFVRRIKSEFGIRYVGVWHALEGYWKGIMPGSPVARECADLLTMTASGYLMPAADPEKAFRFFDKWHTALREAGIDFVKVDNQSSFGGMYEGTCPTAIACRAVNEGLDRSVEKNFGGGLINCMGMDMENVLARPTSALSRNSDDFFPRRENGFAKHIVQNAWNALWHDEVYYCDFDMWWSGAAQAKASAALRAMSGSPVYVSDETGRSDATYILPLLDEDKKIIRCDRAAKPVPDMLFTDVMREKKLLRLFNTCRGSYVLGVFNVSLENLRETHAFTDIPGIDPDRLYTAREYYTGTLRRVYGRDKYEADLPAGEVALWTLTPVLPDGSDRGMKTGTYIAV